MSSDGTDDELPPASSDNDLTGLSGSDNESTSNNDSGSQAEQELTEPRKASGKKRMRGLRKPTRRPSGCWEVDEIHAGSGAPLEPEIARRKFRTVCGYVARDRVSINLKNWKQFKGTPRQNLLKEIMKHFAVPTKWKAAVQRAALCKSRDAWKNWKYVLNKYFVKKGREPFKLYPSITKDAWEEFKRVRKSPEFAALSKKQKELVAKNTNPHNMGVSGYYGKQEQWRAHDESCIDQGSEVPFSDVSCPRSRDYLLARSKIVDGKYVLQKPEYIELHKSMVS